MVQVILRKKQGKEVVLIEHKIRLTKGSQIERYFGADTTMVNSYHHQGIKRLGKNFVASAFSEDGLIEAIEGTGSNFEFAVQFHPEKINLSDLIISRYLLILFLGLKKDSSGDRFSIWNHGD